MVPLRHPVSLVRHPVEGAHSGSAQGDHPYLTFVIHFLNGASSKFGSGVDSHVGDE